MVVMGRIGAPFGVKGWVRVQPFTEKTDSLLQYPQWWLQGASGWDRRDVEQRSVHGDVLVVRFADVDDRDAAHSLKGREVAIPRGQLPAPEVGEYYWTDLVGLAVTNTSGESLGVVKRLFASGANPVLVVEDERERLLPFVDAVIKQVDLEAGTILVEWELDF